VVLVGGSLMAANTQRVGRHHRFTHGVDDRPGRQEAGKQITVTTYRAATARAVSRQI